jgi:hypothetical protein
MIIINVNVLFCFSERAKNNLFAIMVTMCGQSHGLTGRALQTYQQDPDYRELHILNTWRNPVKS